MKIEITKMESGGIYYRFTSENTKEQTALAILRDANAYSQYVAKVPVSKELEDELLEQVRLFQSTRKLSNFSLTNRPLGLR